MWMKCSLVSVEGRLTKIGSDPGGSLRHMARALYHCANLCYYSNVQRKHKLPEGGDAVTGKESVSRDKGGVND